MVNDPGGVNFLIFLGTLMDIRTALWWLVGATTTIPVSILVNTLYLGRKKG